MGKNKTDLLSAHVDNIDSNSCDLVRLIEQMKISASKDCDLANADTTYETMLRNQHCGRLLCLDDSLINAGLKQVIIN